MYAISIEFDDLSYDLAVVWIWLPVIHIAQQSYDPLLPTMWRELVKCKKSSLCGMPLMLPKTKTRQGTE